MRCLEDTWAAVKEYSDAAEKYGNARPDAEGKEYNKKFRTLGGDADDEEMPGGHALGLQPLRARAAATAAAARETTVSGAGMRRANEVQELWQKDAHVLPEAQGGWYGRCDRTPVHSAR